MEETNCFNKLKKQKFYKKKDNNHEDCLPSTNWPG